MYIDENIKLNIIDLPKILQNIISDCEKYDNPNDEILYLGRADALEVMSKQMYLDSRISENQMHIIFRKYCGLE